MPDNPEAHGGSRSRSHLIDLSHHIASGMITYKGLPAPVVCDYLARDQAPAIYGDGYEFHIARIDMVVNTGTYLDAPSHAFAAGGDIASLDLARVASLPGFVVRAPFARSLLVDVPAFESLEPAFLRGAAVLVHTGWDEHWGTDAYFANHPALTAAAAAYLRDAQVALVGIDSHNIDDTRDDQPGAKPRPVHRTLLGGGVLICEHMTNLGALPDSGFRFSAVPPKVAGVGTWPVRAFASID